MSDESEFKPGCDWLVLLGGCGDIAKPAVLAHRPLSAEELQSMERAAQASENLRTSINFGISAIGGLIASAAHNPDMPVSERTFADAGWLLEELGRVSEHLAGIGSDAEHYLNPQNWRWVSEESDLAHQEHLETRRGKRAGETATVAPPVKEGGRS